MTKQTQILVAAGCGVVLLGAGAYFLLSKGSSNPPATTTAAAPPVPAPPSQVARTMPGAGAPRVPGAPMGHGAGKRPGFQAPGKTGKPGRGIFANGPGGKPQAGAARSAAATKAPAQVASTGPTTVPHNADPFYVTWRKAPPPPNVFDTVQPIRLAAAFVPTPPSPGTEVREVPSRRVSGILSGDGVYAILESGQNVEIVKPGFVTDDGYRVVSINADSVRLERKDGNIIRTQDIPLSDVPIGQTTNMGPMNGGGNAPFMGGRPGMGGAPSMGGRPGMGGGLYQGK